MHIKVKSIIITLLFLFAAYTTPAHATIYLNLNSEEGTVGTNVPNPPFCQTPCSGGGALATYQSSGGAAQGSKYYQWQTVDNQTQYYTESHINYPSGITNIMGRTFYLAYYFRMDRINGLDIWHECSHCGSANKGIYLWGSYLRWTAGMGQWDGLWAANQDHRFTVWVGDSNTYNLNANLKTDGTYCQNQNGYSCANPIQLQYERWYSLVFAVTIASDNTGSFALYIDGVKIMEYTNITTVANPSPSITDLYFGGTIAQGAYDAPAHYEKFDALMLTDNWQDIVDGGYLGSGGGDTQAPTVPTNLSAQAVSSSQINLSWTASTDDTGVTGYRIYRDGAQIDTSATNFYSNIGLSASTTYTYSVSAYDAVNNVSSQSVSASATTAADTGGNAGGSGGDSSSGGSGCGFVKDNNGKGQGAKGEGLALMIMLIIVLAGIAIAKRAFKRRTATNKAGGKSLNFKSGLIGLTLLFLFAVYTPASATVYLNLNAEEGTVGTNVPNPPFCQTPCSGLGALATYQSNGGTPQGSKYYQWQTVNNQTEHYTETVLPDDFGTTNLNLKLALPCY